MTFLAFDRLSRRPMASDGGLTIGLVNNMPDAALKSTERQYRELLTSASADALVRLRLFSLPEVSRSPRALAHIAEHHEPIENLWKGAIDGLIVTGNAPRAARVNDEPYWPALARLVDWADGNTISTVWSCLAAHAAVLHLDGIERRPLAGKLSGVFECFRVGAHPLVGIGPGRWKVPHSRHNDLPERALAARGYRLLSWSDAAGADLFIKRRQSLFVFLQGHPEYDATALLREYRRDVQSFLSGETEHYPETPIGYLAAETEAAMRGFAGRARMGRDPALITEFPMTVAERGLDAPWRGAAIRLYANWLTYLARERARRAAWSTPVGVPPQRALHPSYVRA